MTLCEIMCPLYFWMVLNKHPHTVMHECVAITNNNTSYIMKTIYIKHGCKKHTMRKYKFPKPIRYYHKKAYNQTKLVSSARLSLIAAPR